MVQTRIVNEVGVSCGEITSAHLGTLVTMDLRNASITTLRNSDFGGMVSLIQLMLGGNMLTTLPADVFDGLGALRQLDLNDNALVTLPADVFDGLGALGRLELNGNALATLPAALFDGLTELRHLLVNDNRLTELPDGLFSGLELSTLRLDGNTNAPFPLNLELEQQGSGQVRVRIRQAAPLDIRVFWTASGGATGTGNVLLEAGRQVTEGFGRPSSSPVLYRLQLADVLTRLLAGPAYQGFEVRIPPPVAGVLFTPTALVLREEEMATYTVSLNHAPTGMVTITPDDSAAGDVTVVSGALTFTTANWHLGQTVTITTSDDLDVRDDIVTIVHAVSGYGMITTAGIMVTVSDDDAPRFGAATVAPQFYAVDDAIPTLTLPAAFLSGGRLRYTITPVLPAGLTLDPDARTLSGVPMAVMPTSVYTWTATGLGHSVHLLFDITVHRTSVCIRTPVVRDTLVSLAQVSDCIAVTPAHLSGITSLDLSFANIATLQSRDFVGLSALDVLDLSGNRLTTLPLGMFNDLGALRLLNLFGNDLSSLPAGVFEGLSGLTGLALQSNSLTTLQVGVFNGLGAVTELFLGRNRLATLGSGAFTGLDALATLHLNNNRLATLGAGVFTGLGTLTTLNLNHNRLTTLGAGAFTGLDALTTLRLDTMRLSGQPTLTTLPAGVFAGLDTLTTLHLNDNGFTTLPAGAFTGLGALTELRLNDNGLTTLPAGLFRGLRSLTSLFLHGNPAGTFTLTVDVEQQGDGRGRARLHEAAPLTLTVQWMQGANTGTVTIAAGQSTSDPFGMAMAAPPVVTLSMPRFAVTEATSDTAGRYTGFQPDAVGARAGVILSPAALTMPEGAAASYTVWLNSMTSRTVTVTPVAPAGGDGRVSGALTFTTTDWHVAQTVTVMATHDADAEDDTITITHTVSGYDGVTAGQVVASVVDDEMPRFDAVVREQTYVTGRAIATLTLPAYVGSANPATLSYALLPAGDIPDGLVLDADARTLSGTPTTATPAVTLTWVVRDSADRTASQPVMLTVLANAVPDFGGAAVASQAYLVNRPIPVLTLPAGRGGNGALSYALLPVSDIPDGLILNLTARTLSGTPITAVPSVTLTWTVSDTDSDGSADDETDLPFTVGVEIDETPGFGGAQIPSLVYIVDLPIPPLTLPVGVGGNGALHHALHPALAIPGLTLDIAARTLSGTPTATASMSLVWTVTDSDIHVGAADEGRLPFTVVVERDIAPDFGAANVGSRIYGVDVPVVAMALPAAGGGNGVLSYELVGDLHDGLQVDVNTRTITGTPENRAPARSYTWIVTDINGDTDRLTFTIEIQRTSLCGRTPAVRDAILAATRLSDCTNVTHARLGLISRLNVNGSVGTLQLGDFAELDFLTRLDLSNSQLTSLPVGIFAGLDRLTNLILSNNRLTSLPAGVFTGPSPSVPSSSVPTPPPSFLRTQESMGLRSLQELNLGNNRLAALQAEAFAGLGTLRELSLAGNPFTTLPAGVFGRLGTLQELNLASSQLPTLPTGLFDGIGPLTGLNLASGAGGLYTLNVDLEHQGDGRVQARILEAAPRDITVRWTAPNGESGTVTIRSGQRTSAVFGPSVTSAGMVSISASFVGTVDDTTDNMGDYRGFRLATVSPRPGVIVTPPDLVVFEGGTATYVVQLNAAPAGVVTVTPDAGSSGGLVSVSAALIFGPANWRTAQTVTVTAGRDMDTSHDTVTIRHIISGYGAMPLSRPVTVTVADASRPSFGRASVTPQTYITGTTILPLRLPEAIGGNGALRYALLPASDIPPGLVLAVHTRTLAGVPFIASQSVTLTWTATDTDGRTDGLPVMIMVEADVVPDFGAARVAPLTYNVDTAPPAVTLPAAVGGNGPLRYTLSPPPPG